MKMRTQIHRTRTRGLLCAEMVISMGILAAVMFPLAYQLERDARLCKAYYQEAVALEIVDGEMEILAAGEWRAFPKGTQPYPVQAQSATNLPAGRFLLTVSDDKVRLEWKPAKAHGARPVAREITLAAGAAKGGAKP